MCIKCEIKKVIMGVAGVETKEVPAGKIDTGLLLKFNMNNNAQEELEAEVEAALKAAAAEVAERFEARVDELEAEHKSLWAEVCQQLNLDPEGDHSLNRKTGEVVTEVVEKKAPAGSH